MTWNDSGIQIIFGDQVLSLPYFSVIIFFAIFAVLALLIYRYTGTVGSGKNRRCRWQRVPGGQKASLTEWRCQTCGVTAYSNDDKAPKECKKTLKSGL